MLSSTRYFLSNFVRTTKVFKPQTEYNYVRHYTKKYDYIHDGRRHEADIPAKPKDPVCGDCETRKKKKKGILYKIKLKMIEGGTNFGTPFRRIQCKDPAGDGGKGPKEQKALPAPEPKEEKKKEKALKLPRPPNRVQVAVLGAETGIGQYVALLLKQCACIKRLNLYEACDTRGCNRNIGQVADDLANINTSCNVQAYRCSCKELEKALQNADIVLMLESGFVCAGMTMDCRFYQQAPLVKCYADVIATECPRAFIIVCTTPIDCMVPLIAETLKETGWYDPKKLLGSLAVPEMRACTLAARALSLEPRCVRIPCVGGTEGESLVPLFSRAVEYFEFPEHNAKLMTDAVRTTPQAVSRTDDQCCLRAADLSEAHALSRLIVNVAHALLCHDAPRVTGFVETDLAHVISPASKYSARGILLDKTGICKQFDMPSRISRLETQLYCNAVEATRCNIEFAEAYYSEIHERNMDKSMMLAQNKFMWPKTYEHITRCLCKDIEQAVDKHVTAAQKCRDACRQR